MGGTEKKTISIIIPVYNETPVLSILFDELSQVLDRLQSQYELQVLLVDDGSTDDSWQMIADQSAADKRFSGLALTVRGPSMSTGPGKIELQGVAEVAGEKVFVLRFIRGRNPEWVQRPFFARFSPTATWLHDLRPAFGEESFFFEEEYRQMQVTAAAE